MSTTEVPLNDEVNSCEVDNTSDIRSKQVDKKIDDFLLATRVLGRLKDIVRSTHLQFKDFISHKDKEGNTIIGVDVSDLQCQLDTILDEGITKYNDYIVKCINIDNGVCDLDNTK